VLSISIEHIKYSTPVASNLEGEEDSTLSLSSFFA